MCRGFNSYRKQLFVVCSENCFTKSLFRKYTHDSRPLKIVYKRLKCMKLSMYEFYIRSQFMWYWYKVILHYEKLYLTSYLQRKLGITSTNILFYSPLAVCTYVCMYTYTIILRTKRSGHGKAHRRKNVMLLPSAILLMQMHTLPYESVHPSCVLRCNMELRIYVWCFTIECSFKCPLSRKLLF